MDFLFNDLSLEGQFHDIAAAREAIRRIMSIRALAKRYGHEVYCHKGLGQAQITPTMIMPQFLGQLEQEERTALLAWANRSGPFWDEERRHDGSDYLECRGDMVVTDKAIGEAAFCCLHGIERRLLSVTPSTWEETPIEVTWVLNPEPNRTVEVANHWAIAGLESHFQNAAPAIVSWAGLETHARASYLNLNFLDNAFAPLGNQPFVQGACEQIKVLLNTLNTLKNCFTDEGGWNDLGHKIFREHFNSRKAWFGDSSDDEKVKWRAEMTFPHPNGSGETIFCPFHGKVKWPQMRIHFTYPIQKTSQLYIAYVGPKITKK